MNQAEADPPIACTLSAGDMTQRRAWIAQLNRAALRGHVRHDLRLELTYAIEARDDVLRMVSGEQACCAFLTFEVVEEGDAIRVAVTAPEAARGAADTVFEALLARAAAQGSRCSCGSGG